MVRGIVKLGLAAGCLLLPALSAAKTPDPVLVSKWNPNDSYKFNKQNHLLDIRKDQADCGAESWDHVAMTDIGSGEEHPHLNVLKLRTCHNYDVRVKKWTHLHRTDCGDENNFKTIVSYSGVTTTVDSHGALDVVGEVIIETCYTAPQYLPPLDCQGKWYNKPTWQFAYNVTVPFDLIYEPEECGGRFRETLKTKTPYEITYWNCEELGNTGAARIIFQTEPLSHQKAVHQTVEEYSRGELRMGISESARCPYFNQVPMPPWDGHCSVDECQNMNFRDFKLNPSR